MKPIVLLCCVITLAGCASQIKTVEVPIRVSCVTSTIAPPARLTPCPLAVTDAQCIKRAKLDIERLQSAFDEQSRVIEACK